MSITCTQQDIAVTHLKTVDTALLTLRCEEVITNATYQWLSGMVTGALRTLCEVDVEHDERCDCKGTEKIEPLLVPSSTTCGTQVKEF